MKTIQTILILFLLTSITSATVHYVSKTGSSTPPYTNWETAADSIQKAIDICEFGDTVYVGEGIYEEKIVMCEGLSLIGAGIDKTILDMENLSIDVSYTVTMADKCLLEGFTLKNYHNPSDPFYYNMIRGVKISPPGRESISCTVRNNKISGFYLSIFIYEADVKVESNIIVECSDVIMLFGSLYATYITINNNYFGKVQRIIRGAEGSFVTYTNNVATLIKKFSNGIVGLGIPELVVKNSIFISTGGIPMGINNHPFSGLIENNTFYGSFWNGISVSDNHYVLNNIVVNSTDDTRVSGINGHPDKVLYNLVYMDKHFNPFYKFTPDSTNIVADPMFVDPEGHDFRLQMYSPAIDAGDPNIKDVDGSRSDIGAFGGPGGESYVYQDMPPMPPDIDTVMRDDNILTIYWERNTEADFYFYTLYKSINDDSTNYEVVTTTQDTSTTITLDEYLEHQYFTLTATDKQGNESDIAEIISIITGIEEPEIAPESYKLFQNYPNPFNGETVITFQIPEAGTVEIFLYDITGAKILEVANGFYQPGIYRETISLSHRKQDSFASSIYFYRMQATNTNNQLIFNDHKKMIYLK